MRAASAPAAAAMASPHMVTTTRVQSWLGGQLLADDIPVAAGTLEIDTSLPVPERITLSVPATGTWLPDGPDHPLSWHGQRLRVRRGVVVGGQEHLVDLGWYRTEEAGPAAGDVVAVTATGLLEVAAEARFLQPLALPAGPSYAAAVRRVLAGLLPVAVEGVTDRAVTARVWEEDRLDALYELVDTWPARMRVDPGGVLLVTAAHADTDPVVADIVDGEDGTLVQLTPAGSRQGVYNGYRASTIPAGDEAPLRAIVVDRESGSPTRWNGPYGRVPAFYASPLLQTTAQCSAAAATLLARSLSRAPTITVEAAPNLLLEPGDVARVRRGGYDVDARVVSQVLPLVAEGGAMRLGLSVLRERT